MYKGHLKQIFSECFNGSLCICPAQDTTPLHLLSRIIGCHFCVSAFSIYAFCQNAVTSLIILLDTKIIIHNWNVHVCLVFGATDSVEKIFTLCFPCKWPLVLSRPSRASCPVSRFCRFCENAAPAPVLTKDVHSLGESNIWVLFQLEPGL